MTTMTKSNYKNIRITLKDLYKEYEYPCWDTDLLLKNIVPIPYVPIKNLKCEHKYALTYNEWKEILTVYFKNIIWYLVSGRSYKIPCLMGYFKLRKIKGGGINWNEFYKTNTLKKHRNPHLMYNRLVIFWDKKAPQATLRNKSLFRFKLIKHVWKDIYNWINKDLSRINNFTE